MPTKHRRHAVTETPAVRDALNELRQELGTERVEMGELVVIGARQKAAQLRNRRERSEAARKRLADLIRSGGLNELVDPEAADELRRPPFGRRS
jgi:hypothetical protein